MNIDGDIIDHEVLNLLDESLIKKAFDTINLKKVSKAFYGDESLTESEIEAVARAIEGLEFSIIDLWQYSFETGEENLDSKTQFQKLCFKCFKLMNALPIPEDKFGKIKHILKLTTYAYLGEKWEDMRRFLIERQEVWSIDQTENNDWDDRMFSTIYLSILYLVRKSSWQDLDESVKLINSLRSEQSKYENQYLNEVEAQYKRGAALELASLYHLAKAVDLVSEYMLQGSPRDVLEQISFHFDKSIAYAQNVRIVELDLLLRMLHSTFKKMIFNSIRR